MSKKRKQYGASLKAKVALGALKGDHITSELAARFQIHPTMVSIWKRELMEHASDLFDTNGRKQNDHQHQIDTLYRQIGQLTVERNFLARKLDH